MGRRYLSKRQREVIDELFINELSDKGDDKKSGQDVLRKLNVSRVVFNRWLGEAIFTVELERRVQWCRLQSELILARNKPTAAERLVELTTSESAETARKACMDIIGMPGWGLTGTDKKSKEEGAYEVSPELAGRVLAAMAAADNSS